MGFNIIIIKSLILLLSFLGYTVYLKKKFDLRVEFSPIIICSSIGIAMFLAGIFNIMPIATIIILLLGIIQLRLIRKDTFNSEEIIKLSIFAIITLYFLYYLRDIQFTDYDNFSHWAMVIREMLETDSLPTRASKLIEFNSYPTGTAGFIYFVSKIIGTTEGIEAFAQMIILLSGIFSISAFINKKNWYLSIVLIVLSVYFFVYNIFITEILVDTVLPVLGLAIVSILVYYREKDIDKILYFTAPMIAFLLIVKNSGMYFSIVSIIYIYLLIREKKEGYKYNKKITIYSIVPMLLLMVIWKIHVMLTFGNEGVSKHSFSFKNYAKTILNKNLSDIKIITTNFVNTVIDINNFAAIFIIMFIFVCAIFYIIHKIKHTNYEFKFEKKVIVGIILIYASYQIGLFLMYMFSMPTNEAIILASYNRYHKTITLYLFGIISILCLKYSLEWKGMDNLKTILISAVLILFAFISLKYDVNYDLVYSEKDYTGTMRYQIKELKKEYNINEGEKYFIYVGKPVESSGYIYYTSKYEFRSGDIQVYNAGEINGKEINLKDFDYVISLRNDENIMPILNANGINDYKEVIEMK